MRKYYRLIYLPILFKSNINKPSKVDHIYSSTAISITEASITDSSTTASTSTSSTTVYWTSCCQFPSPVAALHVLQQTSLTLECILSFLEQPRYLTMLKQFLYSSSQSCSDLHDSQHTSLNFSLLMVVFLQSKFSARCMHPYPYLLGQFFSSSSLCLSLPLSHELQQMSFRSLTPLVVRNLVALQSYC